MTVNDSSAFDVLIAGGGCVGATLACALGEVGFRVGLIEARPPATDWPAGSVDLRVYAVTVASQRIFENLDAWPGMLARGVSPYEAMEVWDAASGGRIRFDAAEIGEPVLGHIIEQRVMVAALMERLEALPGVQRLCPAEVTDFETAGDAVRVRLGDGRQLGAKLLVAADGKGSRVRERAAIPVQRYDYRQQAVVCVVSTERPNPATAWQRFLAEGPLAFLPLADGRSSIVWSTTPEQAEELCALDEAAFRARLGEAFDYRLGAITAVGERARFPLARQHAERYVEPRLALVGDAAHVIHPLAGQGVNLGLLDAAALAEVLAGTRERGRDIGGLSALRKYERWRRGDNLAMMLAMDGFKHLFGSELPPLQRLRGLGLGLADRLTPLKTLLVRHAMGLDGDLPALARPHISAAGAGLA
ncbi:UbiH/UbiF/VisC/COQ6 family ubiquinone biosynthesis hydroxylase [Thiohalobacter sp. IOR34]|uniref:UbiH/UbiF/VisC/COQ6 family ubiquinone biosynthesis hydroxylase n=1 Tax=Thiohalobacter sp. IOR34 TaxID=3057176 RepID=UPI0025B056E4|nr:UbiH/UbiF/VisC/COQ6 family ubiquinone biosynthesis hydroxylase [Thiohalobacter sp. IOR34]WJW75878.1 UbiH/UbiF/VisC/COQ6 family ubiquinone biosynthesis hydroxylase [Thiohalobacter sp. IOR34]